MKKLHSATLYALFGVAYLFVSKIVLFIYPELIFGRIVPTIHMGLMIMSLLSLAQFFWTLFRSEVLKGRPVLLSVTLPAAGVYLALLLARFGFLIDGETARYLPLLQGLLWLAFLTAILMEKERALFSGNLNKAVPAAIGGVALGLINTVPGLKLVSDYSLPGFTLLLAAAAGQAWFLRALLREIKPEEPEG